MPTAEEIRRARGMSRAEAIGTVGIEEGRTFPTEKEQRDTLRAALDEVLDALETVRKVMHFGGSPGEEKYEKVLSDTTALLTKYKEAKP